MCFTTNRKHGALATGRAAQEYSYNNQAIECLVSPLQPRVRIVAVHGRQLSRSMQFGRPRHRVLGVSEECHHPEGYSHRSHCRRRRAGAVVASAWERGSGMHPCVAMGRAADRICAFTRERTPRVSVC